MSSADLSKHLTAYRKAYEDEVAYLNGERGEQPTITLGWLERRIFTRTRTIHERRDTSLTSIPAWEGRTQAVRDKLAEVKAAAAAELEADMQAIREQDSYNQGMAQARTMFKDNPHAYPLEYVRKVVTFRTEEAPPKSAHGKGFVAAYRERLAELEAQEVAEDMAVAERERHSAWLACPHCHPKDS